MYFVCHSCVNWRAKVIHVGDDIITSSNEFRGKGMRFWLIAGLTTLLSWTSRFLVLNCIIAAFFEVGDHVLLYAQTIGHVGHHAHCDHTGQQWDRRNSFWRVLQRFFDRGGSRGVYWHLSGGFSPTTYTCSWGW